MVFPRSMSFVVKFPFSKDVVGLGLAHVTSVKVQGDEHYKSPKRYSKFSLSDQGFLLLFGSGKVRVKEVSAFILGFLVDFAVVLSDLRVLKAMEGANH